LPSFGRLGGIRLRGFRVHVGTLQPLAPLMQLLPEDLIG
jgi:hypothetical protein